MVQATISNQMAGSIFREVTNIQACYNGDVAISKVLMEVDVKGP